MNGTDREYEEEFDRKSNTGPKAPRAPSSCASLKTASTSFAGRSDSESNFADSEATSGGNIFFSYFVYQKCFLWILFYNRPTEI